MMNKVNYNVINKIIEIGRFESISSTFNPNNIWWRSVLYFNRGGGCDDLSYVDFDNNSKLNNFIEDIKSNYDSGSDFNDSIDLEEYCKSLGDYLSNVPSDVKELKEFVQDMSMEELNEIDIRRMP